MHLAYQNTLEAQIILICGFKEFKMKAEGKKSRTRSFSFIVARNIEIKNVLEPRTRPFADKNLKVSV
jgi:hypothetical protein